MHTYSNAIVLYMAAVHVLIFACANLYCQVASAGPSVFTAHQLSLPAEQHQAETIALCLAPLHMGSVFLLRSRGNIEMRP